MSLSSSHFWKETASSSTCSTGASVGPSIGRRSFYSGIPGVSASGLPIPTTVLFDVGGIVRWVDQSETYQRRSDPERVQQALQQLP